MMIWFTPEKSNLYNCPKEERESRVHRESPHNKADNLIMNAERIPFLQGTRRQYHKSTYEIRTA